MPNVNLLSSQYSPLNPSTHRHINFPPCKLLQLPPFKQETVAHGSLSFPYKKKKKTRQNDQSANFVSSHRPCSDLLGALARAPCSGNKIYGRCLDTRTPVP